MEQQSQSAGEEWVDIVNKNNEVIAKASRQQMHAERLRHRASYIVVHDGAGNILVQCRTASKDFYPGYLDATAGGVVQSGEGMLDSARREAEEELGIADVPFAEHGQFYFENDACRVWGSLFSCVTHGPFALQESEVEAVNWLTPEEITGRCDEFTPDSLKALSLWLSRNNAQSFASPCPHGLNRRKRWGRASLPEQGKKMPASGRRGHVWRRKRGISLSPVSTEWRSARPYKRYRPPVRRARGR